MTSVALLRGINVGGHRKLPMAMLKDALVAAGAQSPRTYIQSGNAVFEGVADTDRILDEIETRAGFRPVMLVIPSAVFLDICAANPFADATHDHKALHVFFLAEPSPISEDILIAAKGAEERIALTPDAFYLHTPKYLSGSKIADKAERLLQVKATARNWRTIDAIAKMIKDAP